MTETREHREGRRGDGHRDRLAVEDGQLVTCAAAADDDDRVERAPSQRGDRGDHHRLGPVALHADVAHGQFESDAAPTEFVLEVVPRGGADARDDTDTKRDRAERPSFVGLVETLGGQPAEHLIALLGEVTQRVAWAEPVHLQRSRPVGA